MRWLPQVMAVMSPRALAVGLGAQSGCTAIPTPLMLGPDHLVLSFQPYPTVAHGNVHDPRCVDCVAGLALLDYTQRWGFAVAVTAHTH